MKLFYFSRFSPPDMLASKYLVSGVIEADHLDDAKTKLDAALSKGVRSERSSDFSWNDLAETERAPSGLIAITMANR